jgi:TolA-binding protein
MGRRRKRDEAPLSLFSFQDIMACLTGILIMVSLLLAIDGLSDVMQVTPGKGEPQAPEDRTARIEELRQRIATLKRTVDERRGGIDVTKQEVDLLEERQRQMALDAERTRKRIAKADDDLARITKERTEADSRIATLKEELSRARAAADDQAMRERVRFRPGAKYSKTPVFIEVATKWLAVGELDSSMTPRLVAKIDDPDAERRLVGTIGDRVPDTSFAVLLVHEDAIPRFEQLRKTLYKRGYEVGWQLWDAKGEGGFLDAARAAGDDRLQRDPDAPGAAKP